MSKGLVILFLALCALSCPAQVTPPPLPAWGSDTQKAWWTANSTADRWPQAVTDLTAQLEANYKQNGAACFSNSDFQGWLEHLEWIRLGVECASDLTDDNNFKAFVALGKDETVSHLFVEKMLPQDKKRQALLNLLQLYQANADDLHEYAALGVAYCLVFDQPFPRFWPHPQVKQAAVPLGDRDIVTRFHFYVQSNRDHKLDMDPTQLSFENLKFLVDSQVKLSEFEYAQKSHISFSHFADAFFFIKYDESRVQSGNFAFEWGFPTYALQDIETNGGICVDQAYYATELGKGRGIPTLYFHGQGASGGHAWFGYLSHGGKWELDCGRYESQNYPKGFALDPQTWEEIDDTTMTNFFKNGDKSPNYQPAQNALAWARLHETDPASCKKIMEDARTIMPELSQTWQTEGALLEKTNTSDDDKKTFYQSWITQFTSFPEMKVEGQRNLLAVLRKTGDPDADSVQQDIVLENRSTGFDEGIGGAADALAAKIKVEDWDAAKLEYEKTIRDFGEQGGGTLFYNVISPYIKTCLKSGRTAQAAEGLKFASDRMYIDGSSIIGTAFERLQEDVDKQKRAEAQ